MVNVDDYRAGEKKKEKRKKEKKKRRRLFSGLFNSPLSPKGVYRAQTPELRPLPRRASNYKFERIT